MSKEELFKKYQEIVLKTNGGADDYVVALCQISNLIKDYAEEKDQQIADLETKLAESKKQCQECKHLNKKIELNIKNKLINENQQLKQQLAITEKALKFACEEIAGSCEYCSYKTRIECPVEADCLDEKINYFKTQAKEMLKSDTSL